MSAKTYAGKLFRSACDPGEFLPLTQALVDTTIHHAKDPYYGRNLPGPMTHSIDSDESAESLELITRLNRLSAQIGATATGDKAKIIVYAPNDVLLPHVDAFRDDILLLSLAGVGMYDTFRASDEVIQKTTDGIYPNGKQTSSIELRPGDALQPKYMLHGFRNGNSPRIVLGLMPRH